MDYHDRKAQRAYDAYAGPFVKGTKDKYRACKTAADLHALSKACWAEHNYAVRRANAVSNMTMHGTHPYDSWDALATEARNLAIQVYRKAVRIEGGEAPEAVLPHLQLQAAE